jgi:alpha-mannosidase
MSPVAQTGYYNRAIVIFASGGALLSGAARVVSSRFSIVVARRGGDMKHMNITALRDALRAQRALAGRSVERFIAEAEFAEGLARLHPRRAPRWRRLLERAVQAVADAVAAGRLDRIGRAVRQAEEALAPIGKVAKKYTVHCVGHAHIDMNWQWSWQETVATTHDTFEAVLRLMEEFPDFCFTQSQASVYDIARRYDPRQFEQIQARVAEGRWEVAACHWVEGDKNLASGESLARHLLYTRRFFAEHFGLTVEDVPLDWEPDTFGHAATIPTIAARGGVRWYYLCRGGRADRPAVFWWKGPDGSRVLVNLETTWYVDTLGPHVAAGLLRFCERTGLTDWMCVFGVGDHGGGPTRGDLLRAAEMHTWPIYPSFRFATAGRFFKLLEARGDGWPVLDGELNFEFTGCYSSQSEIKRANRLAENLCQQAECAAVLARRAVGRAYPGEDLRRAWIDTLFGHFHDILPGSCTAEGRHYQLGKFQDTAAAAGSIRTQSLRALAGAVDTTFAGPPRPQGRAAAWVQGDRGGGFGAGIGGGSAAAHDATWPHCVVVCNPTAWDRRDVVSVSLWESGFRSRRPQLDTMRFVVKMPDGRTLPAQQTAQGSWLGHKSVTVAFPVEVGALGYAACAIEPAGTFEKPPSVGYGRDGPTPQVEGFEPAVRVRGNTMENEHIQVEFDPLTGGLVKLADKATGRDLADAAKPMGVLEYVLERPRGMSAWVIGEARKRLCPLELESFASTASGPHVAAMAARARLNDSTLDVLYTLRAGAAWLEIEVRADWLERGGPQVGTPSLRMQFPLALRAARARYEVPFGWLDRDLNGGEEVPALNWADVTGRLRRRGAVAGCAVLNDCKHGHSLDGSTLRLTLLRSSYSPDPLPELGRHTMRMAVVPHGGRLAPAQLIRLGAAFNQPLQVMQTDVHAGRLPPAVAGVAGVTPAGVVVTAVKGCEEGDAVIFRLLETVGKNASARVTLDADLWPRPAEAVEVDFIERPLATSTATAARNAFAVDVPARGIASVRVQFADRMQPGPR